MTGTHKKSPLMRVLYAIRNWRSREMFRAIRQYARGAVLDIGGLDFFESATQAGAQFERWTTLEPDSAKLPLSTDPRFTAVVGDGCQMTFADQQFDTVLNIQVLEHVFEPIKMVNEIARVLKTGGHAIVLLPQTSVLHMAPDHYYNFTRYWVQKAMEQANLEILELIPIGGFWSSMASHLAYFFPKAFGAKEYTFGYRRPALFYVLFPLMALTALIGIPLCLLLSLGDLAEEANNHLVVVRKR